MPRPRKPPRLDIRTEADGRRVWVIRDGQAYFRTGCAIDQARDAEQSLCEYLAHKTARPDTSQRHASKVGIAAVMGLYYEVKAPTIARPAELLKRTQRVTEFWGAMTVDQIKGPSCRQYVKQRGAGSRVAARRELETLRAAVRLYKKEHGLDVTPEFTLPEDSTPRERWLTRDEVAKLIWTARARSRSRHLMRFLIIAAYTGTRHSAILNLQWMPNTTGGWADLENGILYRKAVRARATKKRQPPMRMPSRLVAHMRRWREMDGPLRHVIRYEGKPIKRVEKAFRTLREAAGLGEDVVVHSLRHSRCTWMLQRGVPVWEVAGSLGMSVETVEAVYGHHHADYQKNAAEAY